MALRHEFALFAIGGAIGLVVDAGIVQLLVSAFHWNPYYARVVSFLAAATATWWWNRQRTFAERHSGRSLWSEWMHWMVLMAGGASINYAVYAAFLYLLPWSQRWPAIAVTVGSVMAAGVNFGSARLLLFKRTKTTL